jgi:hypothetical protein
MGGVLGSTCWISTILIWKNLRKLLGFNHALIPRKQIKGMKTKRMKGIYLWMSFFCSVTTIIYISICMRSRSYRRLRITVNLDQLKLSSQQELYPYWAYLLVIKTSMAWLCKRGQLETNQFFWSPTFCWLPKKVSEVKFFKRLPQLKRSFFKRTHCNGAPSIWSEV